jgi:hypothetical protein
MLNFQSKTDDVQIAYYDALAISYNPSDFGISGEEFYFQTNLIFEVR